MSIEFPNSILRPDAIEGESAGHDGHHSIARLSGDRSILRAAHEEWSRLAFLGNGLDARRQPVRRRYSEAAETDDVEENKY